MGLQLVSMSSLGAGSRRLANLVYPVLWVPRASVPSGASSNFLVLRIKAHKTIRVSHAWGPSQLWERGPEKGAFVLLEQA